MIRLLLLSASPRRRELLIRLGLPFDVCPVDVDETPLPGEAPRALAERLARAKAAATPDDARWGIAADTVVALDGDVFGKPAGPDEAVATLHRLRGRWHEVITGVAVHAPGGAIHSAIDRTRVLMRRYSDGEVLEYVAGSDPLDKAGSYAIQHPGFHPVERIDGRRDTVVGLPLSLVTRLLAEAGWPSRAERR